MGMWETMADITSAIQTEQQLYNKELVQLEDIAKKITETPSYNVQPQVQNLVAPQTLQTESLTGATPSKTTNKMLENIKTNWYWYVGGLIVVILGYRYFTAGKKSTYRRR